ncbi:DUF503 family protein [Aerococcaceae bacterium DSM 109652]|uniref:DUF503 family protein n=2 Tax=Fundicoccus ignavus TaxID=2664442 RepID=A0A844CAV2_9LACT|nr:DUF503 family protein [Fundicoccus ignavus]
MVMQMFVIAVRIELIIDEAFSLKDKRSIVKSMLVKLQQKFKLSGAEVDRLDQVNAAIIGLAIVANDLRYAQSVLQKVVNFIDISYPIEIISIEWLDGVGEYD